MTDPVPKMVRDRFKPGDAWICRECGYNRNFKDHEACLNCGRDFYGVKIDRNPKKPNQPPSEMV